MSPKNHSYTPKMHVIRFIYNYIYYTYNIVKDDALFCFSYST